MSQATRVSAATFVKRLGPAPVGRELPAYKTLADRIRSAVLDGRLAVTTGLPSERELAIAMSVSRTTVSATYALLRDQGWIESRRGSGSRLRLPAGQQPGARAVRSRSDRTPSPVTPFGAGGIFGGEQGVGWHDSAGDVGPIIDLTTACLPAPAEPLAAAVARAADRLASYLPTDGYLPFGLPVLREVVADRYTRAGVPTTPEQILITSGAQHAFTLVLGELSAAGDRVLIECPTYPVALDAVRARRRTPVPLGLGEPADPGRVEGETVWDVELFAATLRQSAARLAYLIPDFQNPTGALMDAATRELLIAAASRSRTILMADESFRDVPFPHTDELPPPMSAFDGDGTRVLSLGSVSKSLWGGLRVGWIRASTALVQRLAAARALGDMAGPVLDQLVVAELLAEPAEALAVQRSRLAIGAAALRQALATSLPDWRPTNPAGGTALWVRLPGAFATDLALLAPSAGVRIAPGPRFGPDGTMDSYLRLPFTAPPDRLVTAVSRLAGVAEAASVGARSSLPGWLA